MSFTQVARPAAGFRRHDAAFLAAESAARRFEGLHRDVTPGRVLAAFKRASRAMRTPRSVLLLIDQLFARTKPQDWEAGAAPIVWPRNETLAEELDVSVRQLQNILKRAVSLGFISMKDSPNGHRGGKRGPNGAIQWAYGIDLRPLGTRYPEFLQIAEAADIERRQRDELRRRLTIARKAIAQIAQTALDEGVGGAAWLEEVELARMAAAHARQIGELTSLTAIVERLEARREALLTTFRALVRVPNHGSPPVETPSFDVDISSTGEACFTDFTTTTQPSSSKEHRYSARREERSSRPDPAWLDAETAVDRDLEKYGVDAAFIADVCREVCWELSYGVPRWEDVVGMARREAADLGVPASAWNEAVRVMGRRGAAAAMVAIAHKAGAGLVEKPGAYLRGMSAKAASGDLQLGRTFHGFREKAAAPELQAQRPSVRAFRNTQALIRGVTGAPRARGDGTDS